MRLTISFILTLLCAVALGQPKYPSKTTILKVINLTISQKPTPSNHSSCEYGLCGEWWIGNKDSSFHKLDTLELYNSSNISVNNKDCIFKVWTFYNESKFSEAEASICEEPPTMSIGYINDSIQKEQPNKFEIKENGDACFINIYVNSKSRNSYKVIGLAKTIDKNLGPQSYLLSIVRQK